MINGPIYCGKGVDEALRKDIETLIDGNNIFYAVVKAMDEESLFKPYIDEEREDAHSCGNFGTSAIYGCVLRRLSYLVKEYRKDAERYNQDDEKIATLKKEITQIHEENLRLEENISDILQILGKGENNGRIS